MQGVRLKFPNMCQPVHGRRPQSLGKEFAIYLIGKKKPESPVEINTMMKSAILKTSLDMLYYSGASQALRRIFGGLGAIFMLHHVRPGGGARPGFAPNAGLEVTPNFLDQVISLCKAQGYELLSLHEAVQRLKAGEAQDRPFAAFTLDDAYRDNLVHALPVFKKHRCPFTIFASPSIQDGSCELWWRGLEAVIAGSTRVRAQIGDLSIDMPSIRDDQKRAAWHALYWPVRGLPQHDQRAWIRAFCDLNRVDLGAICRAEAMTWDELRDIARHPLCEVGGHTMHHYAVGRLAEDEARDEMAQCAARLESELGQRPRYLAYPYGDADSAAARDFKLAADVGYLAAVTTRKGLIFPGHRDHLWALPRLSLSGEFQRLRYVEVLMGGSAFAFWNGFRQLNVA
jgi:peptidoglycan/xylan/chitin deacetylase (PgdA/CDA1 family)